MYSLRLLDGSSINGLQRLNPSTFELQSEDSSIYWKLNDDNLSLAVLLDGEDMVDIFIDYTRQNYVCQGGIIHFRIMPFSQKQKMLEYNKRQKKRGKKK